jgi:hypothetical protein
VCLVCAALTACGGAPAPSIGEINPAVVCGSGALPVAVHGENLLARPVRTLAGVAALEVPSARLLAAAGSTVYPEVTWYSTELISLQVPLDQLALETYLLEVRDPDGQRAQKAAALTRVEVPPVSVTRVTPGALCIRDKDTTITVDGSGFLAGASVSIRDGTGAVVQRISAQATDTTVTITLAAGSLSPGEYTLVVENPEQNGCIATAASPLVIDPPPLLAQVQSGAVCADGGQVVVVGSGLQPGATVELTVTGFTLGASLVDVTSSNSAIVTFPASSIPHNDQADLVWHNPDGCSMTLPGGVRINPGHGVCG